MGKSKKASEREGKGELGGRAKSGEEPKPTLGRLAFPSFRPTAERPTTRELNLIFPLFLSVSSVRPSVQAAVKILAKTERLASESCASVPLA